MKINANLEGKVAFITGSSRGIGKAIALRLAEEGVKIAITGKTTTSHPRLPGTIYSAVEEVEAAGSQGLAIELDVRREGMLKAAIEKTAAHFGRLDILVNNASAIFLAGTEHTPEKRFDLMHQVNVRGTYLSSKYAIPFLRQSDNPHILMLSPPMDMKPQWFGNHLAYTLSKYGMSMCVLGLAEELKDEGIAVNALWPKTLIATAAVGNLLGGEAMLRQCRKPQIVADAAVAILKRKSGQYSGHFAIDEAILKEEGLKDFSQYAVDPESGLQLDLFLSPEEGD